MVLGYLGSPHGKVALDDVIDPNTRKALTELDSALTDLEEAIRKAGISAPLRLWSCLLADTPPPADYPGCIMYSSDAAIFLKSDGSGWTTI